MENQGLRIVQEPKTEFQSLSSYGKWIASKFFYGIEYNEWNMGWF